MLRVGITGGMGSGKSTVAKIFETLGVPVYYADQAAKKLMHTHPFLKEQIIGLFGPQAYADGVLQKKVIADAMFNDPEKVKAMNRLVHPITIQDAEQWMDQQRSAYALKEAALIFESGSEKQLDAVIGVSSPLPLRLGRIQQRDGLSTDEIMNRMKHQMDETEKMKRCDYIIYNDEQQLLIPQVLHIHEQLLQRAALQGQPLTSNPS
ncbi:MAG TPA: dephospho-CoA kinase [Ferruginibacter sp.]|nr:dephospho-CoA kinase [Ferruginibacter sp.]HRO05784.1 dephospho-CoA kinase [Ferruginibacter sp.]HRO95922.1 dephospho-CoA kinase [Ferruginibacter sp.]HRP48741.1 dephospho-CoA kinase [Ferruginibacter sp.]